MKNNPGCEVQNGIAKHGPSLLHGFKSCQYVNAVYWNTNEVWTFKSTWQPASHPQDTWIEGPCMTPPLRCGLIWLVTFGLLGNSRPNVHGTVVFGRIGHWNSPNRSSYILYCHAFPSSFWLETNIRSHDIRYSRAATLSIGCWMLGWTSLHAWPRVHHIFSKLTAQHSWVLFGSETSCSRFHCVLWCHLIFHNHHEVYSYGCTIVNIFLVYRKWRHSQPGNSNHPS